MSFVFFNPNPAGKMVGDCVIRAICAITDKKWDDAFLEVCSEGLRNYDMPSSDAVWGSYLRKRGFTRHTLPNECPDCYTVTDFCRDHREGLYVIGTGSHAIGVVDGDYLDTMDSGLEIPIYYWEG